MSELNRLISLAPEGLPSTSVNVSTERGGTRYGAINLTELVIHLQDSNASGNLNTWDNLRLEAEDPAASRRICIAIDKQRVTVEVSGDDATWVHGQAARVEVFLKAAGGLEEEKAWSNGRVALASQAITLIGVTVTAWATVVGFKAAGVHSSEQSAAEVVWRMALGVLIGAGPVAAVSFSFLFFMHRANRAQLLPTAEVAHGPWWSRASSADKIALLALTVAAGSFLVALATLGKELLK
ncbi:hypothetical protein ACIGBL_05555 [Streptomyces sp. NPDC085614]|uniref:hypothetical protein n=1 Tax=Streptomyces sp. NPDC085614 TaxID=3365733 RepID=UPI0037CEFE56